MRAQRAQAIRSGQRRLQIIRVRLLDSCVQGSVALLSAGCCGTQRGSGGGGSGPSVVSLFGLSSGWKVRIEGLQLRQEAIGQRCDDDDAFGRRAGPAA